MDITPAHGREETTPPSTFHTNPLTPPPTDEKQARDTDYILGQIAKRRSGNTDQAIYKVDKRVWAAVSQLLPPDDKHSKSPFPTVIIEVAHSQRGVKLSLLAEEYILGSRLVIGVVVGVDIEYRKSKRATFSIWRAELQGPDDDQAWVVEPAIFRHDNGTPNLDQNAGLRLRLEDFADQKTCQQFKDIDRDIFVSCHELYQCLEEAETSAKITMPEEDTLPKTRRRTWAPEEQLDERDEKAYVEDEERSRSKSRSRLDSKPGWIDRALSRRDDPKIWTKSPPFKKILSHVWTTDTTHGVGDPGLLAELDPTGDRWPAFTARVRKAIAHPATALDTALAKHLGTADSSRSAAVHLLRFAFIDDALAAQGFDFARGLDNVPDTRNPTEWYAQARQVQRKIHLHVGPTNSGKTYHALKKLEAAATGYYAGPLRLLAHEVYTRFLAQGKPMDLITGDDVRLHTDPDTCKISSTVEMVSLGRFYDVAVIDEIQMIADQERGWAWTRALLGSKAKELHLCGEELVVPLIEELAATMGDTLEVHRYQRLNPLKAQARSLRGELRRLRKGDCVVSFSVVNIHALKKHIEKETGRHVAIVYGSLPPDTRAQQAALFNDPNNDYDFLVASDAIGMGLNLSIKRIVFEGVTKFNGKTHEPISKDLPVIQRALNTDAPPIQHAGLMPPGQCFDEFANRLPERLPFEYLLSRVCQAASTNPRHRICDIRAQLAIARAIEPVQGLDLAQRLSLSAAPVDLRTADGAHVLRAFAACIAQAKEVTIADVPEIPLEILDGEPQFNKAYLSSLEVLHKAIILYCWLGYRFSYVFKDLDMAFHAKQITEERINTCLTNFSANSLWQKRLERMKQELRHLPPPQPDCADSSASEPPLVGPDNVGQVVGADRAEAPREDDGQELDLAVEELARQAESSADASSPRAPLYSFVSAS
ncbi:hypothetical protein DV737_g894, partial [Chaetothyriales sp. CBS 132003]